MTAKHEILLFIKWLSRGNLMLVSMFAYSRDPTLSCLIKQQSCISKPHITPPTCGSRVW